MTYYNTRTISDIYIYYYGNPGSKVIIKNNGSNYFGVDVVGKEDSYGTIFSDDYTIWYYSAAISNTSAIGIKVY